MGSAGRPDLRRKLTAYAATALSWASKFTRIAEQLSRQLLRRA